MANVKISDLEEKQAITNNDYLIVDDGTGTKKFKGNKFANQSTTYTKAETDALLDEKQDTIEDLQDIREGAELGATALQEVPSTYRTSADQDEIDEGKVDKEEGKSLVSDTDITQITTNKNNITNLQNTKADKTQTNETDRRLKNLYELTQGQVWDFETENVDENLHTIPSGVKAGSIDKIYGNTMAINQLVLETNASSGTIFKEFDSDTKRAIYYISSGFVSWIDGFVKFANTIVGHKYFIKIKGNVNNLINNKRHSIYIRETYSGGVIIENISSTSTITDLDTSKIYTATENTLGVRISGSGNNDGNKNIYYDCETMLIDLTAIENSTGLTFTTTSDVENYLKKLYGYIPSYIPYQENTLLDFNAEEIEVKGINRWDEEWEVGGINTNTGLPEVRNDRIRSKNFCKILPSTLYYKFHQAVGSGNVCVLEYDSEYNFLTYGWGNGPFTTNKNTRYFKIQIDGTTYNHDISINYPSTDTQYHQYQETSIPIPSSVLPLRQAGTIRDEIVDGKKIQRVRTIKITDLNWSYGLYDGVNQFRSTAPSDLKSLGTGWSVINFNGICSMYKLATYNELKSNHNMSIALVSNISLAVADDNCTSVEQFLLKNANTYLNYEISTPIETTIDTPDTFKEYNMEGNGTLEGISDVPSSNTKYDIEYIVKLDESVGA